MNASLIGCCGPSISGPGAARVGCGPVGCVVGAEELGGAAGVWVKARFWREGPLLKAAVYSVAAGEPKVVELSVDLRPIARAIVRTHLAMHRQMEEKRALGSKRVPKVGWSLGSMWKKAKKAAKAIGRSKLVRGVVSVTKAVVKSKAFGAVLGVAAAFPLTAPFAAPALGAYAAANTAIKAVETGRKVVKTATVASNTIQRGVKLAKRVTAAKASTSASVRSAGSQMSAASKAAVAARVKAAGNVKLSAQGKVAVASAITRLPTSSARAAAAQKVAAKLASLAKVKAAVALAKNLPPAASAAVVKTTQLEVQAAPVLKVAAETAKKLRNPAVRKKLTTLAAQGQKAEADLKSIQERAQAGSLDAQKSAAIVNLVARNRARIQAMAQANAGGLPGILITPQGKLVRGRFRVQAQAGQGGLLYQGATQLRERGSFARIAGAYVGRDRLESIAINGDLPIDGIRLTGPGPNALPIGPYEREVGCDGDRACAPCAAARG